MISVCMATYNGEPFIREQLQSILIQLSKEDEVWIADDGSTDGTLKFIQAFQDSRIRVIPPCKTPLGPIYNLERALSHAQGNFIFLADQDDVWLPNKVSKVLEAFHDPSVNCVLHEAFIYAQNESGEWIPKEKIFDLRPPRHGIWQNALKNSFTGCCMAFRRELLNAALPFPQKLPMHDQWIGLCAEKTKKVRFLNEPLVKYRKHSHNVTDLLGGNRASLKQKLLWRLRLARILCAGFRR
ncbi:MAG: glycosyltransferase family 2 protein [Fibrobacter sp.]|nr:glycosyltransferase family 2 protein [Fibrobacter sp.]